MPRDAWSSARRGPDDYGSPVPGDVLKCLDELGINVIRVVADEALAHCPKHYERTGKIDNHPSWSVRVEDGNNIVAGIHNCLSCGYSGNFVDLVRDWLDVPRGQAIGWVRARGGIERARSILERRNRPSGTDTTKTINEASLALSAPAPAWALESRGLTAESAEWFGVRWDTTKDCWVLPIRDAAGTLMGWQEKGTKNRHFLNVPDEVPKSTSLFGYQQLLDDDTDTAILVESPLDAVRLDSVGIPGGISSFGAKVSAKQMTLIVKSPVKWLVIALDNDRDGTVNARTLRYGWSKRELTIRFLNYDRTRSKDIGDMTRKEIEYAVATAIPSPLIRI